MYKLGIFLILFIPLIFVSAETRNIEYALNVSFTPYCVNNVCSNQTVSNFDNSTNITTNYTLQTCSSTCYGKLVVNGIEENKLYFEIDSGSERWKIGGNELRYGYKLADLANLSDITGIRQELQNLTSCFENHRVCSSNLTECSVQKSNAEVMLGEKNNLVTQKDDEIKKKGNERWLFLAGGVLLGILAIKVIVPSIQGRRNPRDPSANQFPSNVGYR